MNARQSTLEHRDTGLHSRVSQIQGDVNVALADLTNVAQQGINAFYKLINSAIGLAEGLSIPVAQIRNLNSVSVDIYHPGADAAINWLAILV